MIRSFYYWKRFHWNQKKFSLKNSLSLYKFNNNINLFNSSNFIFQKSFFSNGINTPKNYSVPMKQLSESFLNGSSSIYVEQMYQSWKKDPLSVHASWAAYFQNIEKGLPPGSAFQLPPSTITSSYQTSSVINEKEISDCMKVLLLIRAYQVRGHLLANTDPLELTTKEIPPELQLNSYGFTESDLDREFYIGTATMSGFLAANRPKMKLRDIIQRLKETYCGTIGYEYMHIQDRSKCNWIRERIETPIQHQFSKEEKLIILDRLIWATNFEGFCALKWPAAKRFGIDGSESLIPGIKALIDKSTDSGVETVVMGMSHRGRLNVLSNVVRKPLEAIFHEFSGGTLLNEGDFYTGSGDVKYHLGTSYVRPTRSGKKVHISLLANPSHLEAVDPVVIGKVRAHQYFAKDNDYLKTMGLLLHGDASFAAQGVVYELFDLSGLPNYTTGGTIHIIINNQIGFTTDPRAGRSTTYCSDIAKMAEIPVFHVNGDDPEAVVHVCELASEWRQTFKSDVVIDLVCYRKFGHNEADEPRFTQPLMYKKIDQQKSTLSKYTEKLLNEGMITSEQLHKIVDKVQNILHEAFNNANKHKPKLTDWLESVWEGFRGPQQISRIRDTGVSIDMLKHVGIAISSTPENFSLHPNLKKLFLARKKSIETGEKIDWGTAETLAYGTLLMEGNHVRLSGQDVERGTFSHRHAVLHDQNNGKTFIPLNNIPNQKEYISVTNSSLSEFGVLGFELGYSLDNPNQLVIWEAQFGDFANGAQVIIDQFIASGEAKWGRQTGIVLLLPHGYDGSGPEHSSARIERFLSLADSDPDIIPNDAVERIIQKSNFQLVNCTTPANFFHVLRRQIHRDFRKPLIVFSPKNLLKHRLCISSLQDLSDSIDNDRFHRLIPETHTNLVPDDKIEKLVFCSGKVYYELFEEREKKNINNIAIVRIEQLYPFPFDRVSEQGRKYKNAQVIWCQEEHKNMGAWLWIAPHIKTALKDSRGSNFWPIYIGRSSAAAPATGSGIEHTIQREKFINEVFSPKNL